MERLHRIMLVLAVCFFVAFVMGPRCVEAFGNVGSGIAEIGPFGVTDLGYSGFVRGAAEIGSPDKFETLLGVQNLFATDDHSHSAPQATQHVVSSTTPVTITVQHPVVTHTPVLATHA